MKCQRQEENCIIALLSNICEERDSWVLTRKKVYQAANLAMTYALVYRMEEGARKISECNCEGCPGKANPMPRVSQPQQRVLCSIRDMKDWKPGETSKVRNDHNELGSKGTFSGFEASCYPIWFCRKPLNYVIQQFSAISEE